MFLYQITGFPVRYTPLVLLKLLQHFFELLSSMNHSNHKFLRFCLQFSTLDRVGQKLKR